MKHRSAMDSRLRLIEQLYDRDDGGDAADRLRAEHPEHRDEIDSIQSMKSALDARPRRRPAPATIDAVLKAAVDASAGRAPVRAHPRGREDRRPRSRRAVYLRSAGAATAVLTVLLFVTTVWKSDLVEPPMPRAEEGVVMGPRLEAPDAAAAPPAAGDAASQAYEEEGSGQGADAAGRAERLNARRTGSGPSSSPIAADRSETFADAPGRVAATPLTLQGDPAPSAARGARRQDIYAQRLQAYDFPVEGRLDGIAGAELGRPRAGTRVVAPVNRTADRAFGERFSVEFDAAFWPNRKSPGDGRRPFELPPDGTWPMQTFAVTSAAPTAEELAWDQGDLVIDMYQQIESIEHGVQRGWEPPSIPLEMVLIANPSADPSIRPTGEQRP